LKAPVAKGAPRPVQIVETTSEVLATETRALPAARQPAGLLAAGEGASQTRFVADASGNIRDLTAGRGNLNPIGSAGPIELGPAPNSAARTGGSIRYGELDALGRPTGIEATITRDMVGTGSDAARSIRPPGFQGQAAGHARGHLLGNQLGGSGKEARNLVTIYQNPANSPVMRGFENQVRAAVESGQAVQYRVTPIYRGGNPMPVGITLQATGDKGFSLQVSVLNRQ
jgi:hypothetical protein